MRSRWAFHEIAFVVLGFVLPIDDGSWLAQERTSLVAMTLAAVALAELVVRRRGVVPTPRRGTASRRALVPLWIYVVVLAAATFTRSLPSERYQLLGPFVLAVVGFGICEGWRRGSWLDVAYRVGCLHIAYALATRSTEVSAIGTTRLTGAGTAVLLGFEATCVFIVAFVRWRDRHRLVPAVWCAASATVVVLAFSRSSLIAFAAGCVVLVAFRTRRNRRLKILAVAALAWVAYLRFSGPIIDVLGGDHPESLANATGRYTIWRELLTNNDQWLRGYGFGVLRDGGGPDAALFARTNGLGSENSGLQALLMAGVTGLAAWVWLASRAAAELWRSRHVERGATVFLGIVLAVAALYSVGMSGQSFNVWWLFGAFSFCDALAPNRQFVTESRAVRR